VTAMTSGMPSANSVLMGGAKAASFANVGEYVGGRILGEPSAYHVREYSRDKPGGGPLAYFPSGDPIMGITVDVQTTQRDPMEPGDRGIRRLYVEKQRQLTAVREAVREAGASGLAANGELYLACTGEEPGKGNEPAKTWHAIYKPPTTPVPTGNSGAPQSFPPAQAQQPAAQQPPAPFTPAAQYVAAQQPQQPQQYAPPAQQPVTVPAGAPAAQTINSATAAAMRNAGIDTSTFNIVD
jgi:hypothetical protein